MRTLIEVTIEKDELDKDGNPQYERSNYWLLHFGLQIQTIESEGKIIPVSYTVAICQKYDTGEIRCFAPEQIRVLGKEVKE